MNNMNKNRRRLLTAAVLALLVYVVAFLMLSRPVIEKARSENTEIYYFVSPKSNSGFRMHRCLLLLFYPLWRIEAIFGGRFEPGHFQPLYDL